MLLDCFFYAIRLQKYHILIFTPVLEVHDFNIDIIYILIINSNHLLLCTLDETENWIIASLPEVM